jgi:uncharacterized membrane protein YfcA
MSRTLLQLLPAAGRSLLINACFLTLLLAIGLLVNAYFPLVGGGSGGLLEKLFTVPFFWALLVGFFAQLVDGSLGMAYGLSVTTLLNAFGYSQSVATACVHVSEIFTSGLSGWYHLRFGNVNKRLVYGLIIPGVLGAVMGALALSSIKEYQHLIKPVIGVYTLFLAITVFRHAFRNRLEKKKTRRLNVLAFSGGFLDSAGGGGWGPLVGSNLLAKGRHPVTVIGSVNLAEFFIAFSSAFTFLFFVKFAEIWVLVLGLIAGGALSAPLAAVVPRLLPKRFLYGFVGFLLGLLSIRNIISGFM